MQTRKNTQAAENQIFKAIDILRSSGQPLESYDLLLFFLLMKKVGWLEKIIIDDLLDFTRQIPAIALEDHTKNGKALLEVFYVLAKELDDLGFDIKTQLIYFFKYFTLDHYQLSFSNVFELFFLRLKGGLFRQLEGQGFQPDSISRIMASIYNLKPGSRVYNPFAGSASFALYLPDHVRYIGQESHRRTWAIGQMRLIANDLLNRCILIYGDSISDWGLRKDAFDLIISNPPFRYKISRKQALNFNLTDFFLDSFFLANSLNSLNETGKAVFLAPNSFLSRKSNLKLRQHIVDKEYLDMVIRFPGGLLSNSNIPFALVAVDKSNKNRHSAFFIDAEDLVEKKGRNRFLSIDNPNDLTTAAKKADKVRKVSSSEIRDEEFELSVYRYTIEKVKEGVLLAEVLKPYRGSIINDEAKGKFITSGILSRITDSPTNIYGSYIDLSKIAYTENIPSKVLRIKGKLMLVSRNLPVFNPVLIEVPEGEDVFVSEGVYVFVVDSSIVNASYLMIMLATEIVQNQLKRIWKSDSVPFFSLKDVLNIRIPLPDLKEQANIATKSRNKNLSLSEAEFKEEFMLLRDDAFNDMAHLVHSLGKYMNSVSSGVSVLEKFLRKQEGKPFDMNMLISIKQNINVAQHLTSIQEKARQASKLVFTHKEGNQFAEPYGELNFIELIQETIDEVLKDDSYQVLSSIDLEGFKVKDERGKRVGLKPMIKAEKEVFSRLMLEIKDNIVTHGFNNRKNNILRVKTYPEYFKNDEKLLGKESNGIILLEIANNGWPLRKGFGREQLVERGYKSPDSKGSGMGGTIIRKIVDSMKGELDLVSDENDIFTVKYILTFPISSIQ